MGSKRIKQPNIMTPKEKANQLFKKMLGQCASDNGGQALSLSKQCALIAVDEMISEFNKSDSLFATNFLTVYWNEVRKEIENL